MACEGCETTVKEALESVKGVTGVQIDRDTNSAAVTGEPDWSELEQAVTDVGYEVTSEVVGPS